MLPDPRKISDLLALYGDTEVVGHKILSDLRKELGIKIPESYLYELTGQGVLTAVKVSRPVSNYIFRVQHENLALVKIPEVRPTGHPVKILATYPKGIGFEEIEGVSKLYPQLIMLLAGAKHSIDILNPYYTGRGSEKIANALVQATLKGVKIRIVSRSDRDENIATLKNYEDFVAFLNENGKPENIQARIFGTSNPDKSSFQLHAKVTCVDGNRCYVGSANITGPALETNLEIGVLLTSTEAKVVHNLFRKAWINSVKI